MQTTSLVAVGVTVGSPAPDLAYSNPQGETRHLAELWAEGPAMVVWLRHFG